jgi:lactate permease
MFSTTIVLSVLPFILFLLLLLWKKVPLLWTSIVTLLAILGLQIVYWQILPIYLLNSSVKGILVAFDIFVIILGAIFFLELLKDIKIIDNIRFRLESFLKDYRVQIILLAWFFENFIEGTAGFGTPAIIVAPLLIGLGLSPLTAVIIGLLGNSTSVVFGAAGTPIRVGFEGLNVASVPIYAALFNSVGFLVPVFMLWVLASQHEDKKGHFWEALPFAVWSGIAFVVPSILIVPFGQEFPSILGAIIGLFLVLITTRLGIFVPKNQRQLREIRAPEIKLPWFKLIVPYALLVLLLILGKFALGTVRLTFPWGLAYQLNLSNPGLSFILAGVPIALLWGRKRLALESFKVALSRTWEPFLVIASMSIIVQLIINSGNNLSGIPSSLSLIAKGFEISALPLLAPMVGAFGSFLTGSATISNIIFGNFLNTASQIMNMNTAKILALELVGAAAGNMIALADIIAAEAVVGLRNKTRYVLKGVIIPCLIYIIIVGLVGLLVGRT